MRYRAIDGDLLSGESYDDIAQAMADSKLVPAPSVEAYREGVAERVNMMMGKEVDTSTNEAFVKSLVECGVLISLEDLDEA